MTPTRRRTLVTPTTVVSLVCFLVLAGLATWVVATRLGGTDPETRPAAPTTTTVTPSPTGAAESDGAPSRVPALTGTPRPDEPGDPGAVVWVEGPRLHVGSRSWDLSPRTVDSFVVVRGGVYFLDSGRLWTTDTRLVRDTGVGGPGHPASDLVTDRGGRHVRVTVSGRQLAYDVRTGRAVPPASVVPLRARDLLGRAANLRVRPLRDDAPADPAAPVRLGPGGARGYGVVTSATRPLDAFVNGSRRRVSPSGVVGDGFELARWTGPGTMWGVALSDGTPLAVLSCDLAAGRCRSLGTLTGEGALLLGGVE
ncbi:MAG: hypothetical protein JWR42_114 [Marmoricola sp.]|nr:hypothetical protein [Marmoricola sp.]